MIQQPPLLDPGSSLPSPLFQPRPGWGGKLRHWIRENLYLLVFRVLILAAIVLIGTSLVHSWRAIKLAQSPSPSPSISPLTVLYEHIAANGVGLTQLAALTLDTYLASHHDLLDTPSHLYAVDALARSAGWRRLIAGEKIVFDTDTLARIVSAAKALTPSQRTAWSLVLFR
jgi:hypothetical protein